MNDQDGSGVAPLHPPAALARRADLNADIDGYVRGAVAASTRRAYRFDWRCFEGWCKANGFRALPADEETALKFLADQLRIPKELTTLKRYCATLGKRHVMTGFPSPFAGARVKEMLRGAARARAGARKPQTPNAKQAFTAEIAEQAFKPADAPVDLAAFGRAYVREVRDHAILLLGLVTALRRAELVAINIEDITWTDTGFTLYVPKTKVDQEGGGRTLGVPRLEDVCPAMCPVRAVLLWLELLNDEVAASSGPLFRSLQPGPDFKKARLGAGQVAEAVKRAIAAAPPELHLDPKRFAAHSLRAGYVTQGRRNGFSLATLMVQTGHTKEDTAKRYDRGGGGVDPFLTSQIKAVFGAFAARSVGFLERPERMALEVALAGHEVEITDVTLPPPAAGVGGSQPGSGAHRVLCTRAARWLELHGKAWTTDTAALEYAGGCADVAAKDRSVFVEAGDTEVAKVVEALDAGESVLLAPYNKDATAYLLTPRKQGPASTLNRLRQWQEANAARAVLAMDDLLSFLK